MALTALQRRVSRILADLRRRNGESYLAGGVALNEALRARRLSRDLDMFHDSSEAVQVSFQQDLNALTNAGLEVEVLLERPGIVRAVFSDSTDSVLVEWVYDSPYRFFPLVADDELGLVLHPLDLATNKVLALAGRVEVRDWADTVTCHTQLQPLGYLAWAASGKDQGLTPDFILEESSRTVRYSAEELAVLEYEGPGPVASDLWHTWRAALKEARELVKILPAQYSGCCVLDSVGVPFRGGLEAANSALARGELIFHKGSIKGAFPSVRAHARVDKP